MLFFHFLISLVLVGFVVAGNRAELVENANFQLFAGQFGVKGTEGDSEAAVDAKIRSPWSIWGDNYGRVFFLTQISYDSCCYNIIRKNYAFCWCG
jgi:hypothetical protein